ncbi:MAG: POTRA domain-containing protein [Ferruginibacter sp.]
MKSKCYLLFSLIIFCLPFLSHAQKNINPPGAVQQTGDILATIDTSSKLLVKDIIISGNKKTKGYIILREIHFKKGDSLIAGHLFQQMEQARRQVYNTTLFSEVFITIDIISATEIVLHITVKEKWYIYPTPQFQLVDRNFNEWLKVYNGDLNRVIYGAKFEHYNLSGRRDRLKVFLLNGYARNFSFNYIAPYSNAALTEGYGIAGSYTQNREISYRTNYYNKSVNYTKQGFVRRSAYGGASYLIRRGYFRQHIISLSYTHYNVDDTVTRFLNPAYFNSTNASQGFPDASYTYYYANTNNINYPLSGQILSTSFTKRGTGFKGGVNMTTLDLSYQKFIPHNHNWYSNFQVISKIKLPFDQPYINLRSMGYLDNYMRGLEYYVIDGVASFIGKYTLRKKLIAFKIHPPVFKKLIPVIPFSFYGKAYGDIGYNYIRPQFDSRLNNRFLYTSGFGVDILSFWDMRLSLEYSFNQLGENGLFLHAKGGF